ncbi:MAG: DNA repair protein RadC [Candidatus Thiodiazotropha taylori]|nr:DNA repair protein RadC [Candidatus Thiodiazotropha taylori]MCW4316757.1 DNA repair protein RadC [Candidatus Thiodiazotropha taylori]
MELTKDQQQTIDLALSILEGLYQRESLQATDPERVKQYCRLNLAHLEHEVFAILLLDQKHRLISFETLFRGTIDGASVYPREVAKIVLQANAAAVILSHNHPSGIAEPSRADLAITQRLIEVLRLLEVRVLDHIIVGADYAYSFAQHGKL